MADLILPLKAEYFDAIRDGTKAKEYRLANAYWTKRLVGRSFDGIVLTKGYPARDDTARRLRRDWRGFTVETITHPHFGAEPVRVFAIDVRTDERSAAPTPLTGAKLPNVPDPVPALEGVRNA